MFRLQF